MTTKLHIPPARPGLVSRPRLVERLDAGLHRKLTLVVTLMKWVSIPFLGLLLYHLVTSEETLDTVRSRVAVVTALVVQVALTFVLPPSIGKDVLWSSLRWTVPAVSAVGDGAADD